MVDIKTGISQNQFAEFKIPLFKNNNTITTIEKRKEP
jgi:hypothetical protein